MTYEKCIRAPEEPQWDEWSDTVLVPALCAGDGPWVATRFELTAKPQLGHARARLHPRHDLRARRRRRRPRRRPARSMRSTRSAPTGASTPRTRPWAPTCSWPTARSGRSRSRRPRCTATSSPTCSATTRHAKPSGTRGTTSSTSPTCSRAARSTRCHAGSAASRVREGCELPHALRRRDRDRRGSRRTIVGDPRRDRRGRPQARDPRGRAHRHAAPDRPLRRHRIPTRRVTGRAEHAEARSSVRASDQGVTMAGVSSDRCEAEQYEAPGSSAHGDRPDAHRDPAQLQPRHVGANGRYPPCVRPRCRDRGVGSDVSPSGAHARRRRRRGDDVKYMLLIYGNQELWESFPADAVLRADPRDRCAARGAARVGRVRRRVRRRRSGDGEDGPRRRRRPRGDRRPVHRGQGVPRAASPSSTARASNARSRSRPPTPRRGSSRWRCDRSSTRRRRRCEHRGRRRGSAAQRSRRRSSAPSSGGTGTSTRARTRSKRRCSPPRSSGPTTACPTNPRGWLFTVARAPPDRRAPGRRSPSTSGGPHRRARASRRVRRGRPRPTTPRRSTTTTRCSCCSCAATRRSRRRRSSRSRCARSAG